MKKKTQKMALPHIAKLYDLVEQMRAEVAALKGFGVEVRIRRSPDAQDPFGDIAAMQITLLPGAPVLT